MLMLSITFLNVSSQCYTMTAADVIAECDELQTVGWDVNGIGSGCSYSLSPGAADADITPTTEVFSAGTYSEPCICPALDCPDELTGFEVCKTITTNNEMVEFCDTILLDPAPGEISVSKTSNAQDGITNDVPYNYTITVDNVGGYEAVVSIDDQIPDCLSTTQTFPVAATIAPGESFVLEFEVTPSKCGEVDLSNTATVTGSAEDGTKFDEEAETIVSSSECNDQCLTTFAVDNNTPQISIPSDNINRFFDWTIDWSITNVSFTCGGEQTSCDTDILIPASASNTTFSNGFTSGLSGFAPVTFGKSAYAVQPDLFANYWYFESACGCTEFTVSLMSENKTEVLLPFTATESMVCEAPEFDLGKASCEPAIANTLSFTLEGAPVDLETVDISTLIFDLTLFGGTTGMTFADLAALQAYLDATTCVYTYNAGTFKNTSTDPNCATVVLPVTQETVGEGCYVLGETFLTGAGATWADFLNFLFGTDVYFFNTGDSGLGTLVGVVPADLNSFATLVGGTVSNGNIYTNSPPSESVVFAGSGANPIDVPWEMTTTGCP